MSEFARRFAVAVGTVAFGVIATAGPIEASVARPADSTARFHVECPRNAYVGAWPSTYSFTTSFGFDYLPKRRSAQPDVYLFDYGDGPHFSSQSWDDARVTGLQHTYRRPGTYTFHAAVMDIKGRRHDAQCSWTWLGYTPRPSRGGGGSSSSSNSTTRTGAICDDGWRSSSTGSGTCSSHRGVRSWLYG